MARLITDFYKGTDVYSDGCIEDQILEIAARGAGLEEFLTEEVPYPIVYHLSRERENILCWYPFDQGAHILEVGAGCGALSGALCRNEVQVTSVDLSLKRSRINYERNQQYENLQIYVGNLNDMVFAEQFDYIILNGVLEYALSFTEGSHPYETFLENQLKYLKKDGKLLLAIENRLGLKYFAGAPEDHTDAVGLGLNRYRGNRSVRTFSKTELTSLLKACGLEHIRFYYPYPDYKFPNEIFTDETLQKNGYGRDYYNYLEGRLELFSESMVAQDLAREDIAGTLANSFLVEAKRTDWKEEKEILYVKINSDRAQQFRIVTRIERENGACQVYKWAMSEEAKAHVERMWKQENQWQLGKYACLAGTWDGTGVCYPYLQEDTLDRRIFECIDRGNRAEIVWILQDVFANAFLETKECGAELYSEPFLQVFGKEKRDSVWECVRPANVDLICNNIFQTEDGYKMIDGEWIFDFWVPKPFILFRTLNELYARHAGLEVLIHQEEMFALFQLERADIPVFSAWNQHFTECYVKANEMRYFAREKQTLHLTDAYLRNRRMQAAVYVDYGEGFTEEKKISLQQMLEYGTFSLTCELPDAEKIQALRFDPVEERICKCLVQVRRGEQLLRLEPSGAARRTADFDEFETIDPQYAVPLDWIEGNRIRLEGRIFYGSDQEAIACLAQAQSRLESEKQLLRMQLDDIYASRTWKLRQTIRKIFGK